MPNGPNGQKRPGDVIGAAIVVAELATADDPAKSHRRRSGSAPAQSSSAEQRSKIVDYLRGRGDIAMSTDAIMALTRGEH